MHPATPLRRQWSAVILGLLLAPTHALALPLVTIGNLPSSPSGDDISATDLANTLIFTSVTILSDGDVIVEQPSDLSTIADIRTDAVRPPLRPSVSKVCCAMRTATR